MFVTMPFGEACRKDGIMMFACSTGSSAWHRTGNSVLYSHDMGLEQSVGQPHRKRSMQEKLAKGPAATPSVQTLAVNAHEGIQEDPLKRHYRASPGPGTCSLFYYY